MISFGVIDRLEDVLTGRLTVSARRARDLRNVVADLAAFAAALSLGGTGTMPLLEREDAHVLDKARSPGGRPGS